MRALGLALCLVLLAPKAAMAGEEELWTAVFELGDPAKGTAAEKALLGGGLPAVRVLLKAARSSGEANALSVASRELECWGVGFRNSVWPMSSADDLGPRAASLAARMIAADKSVGSALLASASPFDRSMAILAASKDPARLAEALEATREDTDRRIVAATNAASRCVAPQKVDEKSQLADELRLASDKSERLRAVSRCDEPGFVAAAYLEGLLSGGYSIAGWTRSNDDFVVNIRRGKLESASLAPACALSIYDAAAKQGRFIDGLVIPIVEEVVVPLPVREAAASRAVRDLEQFAEKRRNGIAAKLVNAGYPVVRRVTYDPKDLWAQEDLVKAALRQGKAEAGEVLQLLLSCPSDLIDSRTYLYGFLPTRENADRVAFIAERCPRSRQQALAALVRMGDPRAVGLLAPILSEHGIFDSEVEAAIREARDPAVNAEVARLAAEDVDRAKDVYTRLRRDGLVR